MGIIEGTYDLMKKFVNLAKDKADVLREARAYVNTFGGGHEAESGGAQVDITELMIKVSKAGGELGSVAKELANSLMKSVIASWIGKAHEGAYGISIYFPLRLDRDLYLKLTDFGKDIG